MHTNTPHKITKSENIMTDFSFFEQLSIGAIFWVGYGGLITSFPLNPGAPSGLDLWKSHVHCHSPFEFIGASVLVCLEDIVSLVSLLSFLLLFKIKNKTKPTTVIKKIGCKKKERKYSVYSVNFCMITYCKPHAVLEVTHSFSELRKDSSIKYHTLNQPKMWE